MNKILHVIGCRPNIIKLVKHDNQIVINTGQHYDHNMAGVFLESPDMPEIKYNLGCTKLGEMIDKLIPIIKEESPSFVVVYGDTNSTLAGALAAKYNKIPLIHIEAGMRSYDKTMPEEINRILVDKISDVFICSSEVAVRNLEKEGIQYNVYYSGSNMVDAVLKECPTQEVDGYAKDKYRVLTLHRQSNVDNKYNLKIILDALAESGEFFVWPMHPRTKKNIAEFGYTIPDNISVIEPCDHKKMIHLMAFANQIVTDSGGIQVESYFLRKPCITIRNETEWLETVEEGWNVLTGVNKQFIINAIKNHHPKPFKHSTNAYGMGNANGKIKNILENL